MLFAKYCTDFKTAIFADIYSFIIPYQFELDNKSLKIIFRAY
jgi:hypothetical protein